MNGPIGRWDAVIIGAGPAGSMAALGLARRGYRVLLLERSRWPRSKVCGGCLNGVALQVLAETGLGTLVADRGGRPLEAVALHAGSRRARLPLPAGAALSRRTFDAAMVDAAVAAGVTFEPETFASVGPVSGVTRRVVLRRGGRQDTIAARVVLVAAGLGAEVVDMGEVPHAAVATGSRIGAGATVDAPLDEYGRGIVYLVSGHQGYVGLVRLESDQLDIGAALAPAAIRRNGGIGSTILAILRGANLPIPAGLDDETVWRGTPPLTRTRQALGAERLFLVGDSAGYVEPFTGEGIGSALASGHALVPLADQAIRTWQGSEVHQWEVRHRHLIQRRQATCRMLRRVLRHPRLVPPAIGLLGAVPALAGPVIRRLNTLLPAEGFPA